MGSEPQRAVPAAFLRWGAWIYLALAIAAVLWLGARDGAIPLSLFVRNDSWIRDLGIGLVAAALLIGAWHLAAVFLPAATKLERIVAETVGPLGVTEILVLALLSGFAEELFFRGAVQSQWGLVPATLLFALLHQGPGREFWLWTMFALIAGAVLGGLMLWRGALLASTVAHVGVNLVGLSRLQRIVPASAPNSI